MPQANTSAPVQTRTFADIECKVPGVFIEGSILTANEAKWANTQVGTVVGNAFGSRVRKALAALNDERAKAFKAKKYDGPLGEDGKPAPATVADTGLTASTFAEMFAEYELGVQAARGEATPRDPVASLVLFLAKEAVKAKIIKKGKKVKDFMDAKITVDGEEVSMFSKLTTDYIAAHPELTDQAKAQLAGASDDDDDAIDAAIAA